MYKIILCVAITLVIAGCAAQSPVVPDHNPLQVSVRPDPGPHMLWGEWTLYFNSTHDKVEAIPCRQESLHLNAVKFLESYCSSCLKIKGIKNNGDSTVDVTVEITHPFTGFPQYTGFDVKGIIMFKGSHEIPDNLSKLPLYPQNYMLSWRRLGDPELLNADGYTYYWSPYYDSGSSQPIFKYYPGKYSHGTPTANINGFLNFYSNENRHMFEVGKSVERVYHIWLPSGPVAAGYAVDACWEPPTTMPVTDPSVDFPVTANEPECYQFSVVINEGNPIETGMCCNIGQSSVHEGRIETNVWYVTEESISHDHPENRIVGIWNETMKFDKPGFTTEQCNAPPEHPNWRCLAELPFYLYDDGTYQLLAYEFHYATLTPKYKVIYPSFYVFEEVLDFH
jgi:hypothetical protein